MGLGTVFIMNSHVANMHEWAELKLKGSSSHGTFMNQEVITVYISAAAQFGVFPGSGRAAEQAVLDVTEI